MAPTVASNAFAVGPGAANERDPAKAVSFEERDDFESKYSSSAGFVLHLGGNLVVKEKTLAAALPAGTTLEILDKALQGHTTNTANADKGMATKTKKEKEKEKRKESAGANPSRVPSVYDQLAPFLINNKRGGKKLLLRVVEHHVLKREVGWTYTTLVPVRHRKKVGSRDDDDNEKEEEDEEEHLPLLVLNLFEEAFNGTLQNCKVYHQTVAAGDKDKETTVDRSKVGKKKKLKTAASAAKTTAETAKANLVVGGTASTATVSVENNITSMDDVTANVVPPSAMLAVTDVMLTSSIEHRAIKEKDTPSRGDSLSPTRGIGDENDDSKTPRRSKRSALLFAAAAVATNTTAGNDDDDDDDNTPKTAVRRRIPARKKR